MKSGTKIPSLIHTHTYIRRAGSKTIYQCFHPDCSHFAHKHILPGKRAKCKCGEEYILESRHLKLAKPVCWRCSTVRADILRREGLTKVQDVLSNLFEPAVNPQSLLKTLQDEEKKRIDKEFDQQFHEG